jgi:hypothetical protein
MSELSKADLIKQGWSYINGHPNHKITTGGEVLSNFSGEWALIKGDINNCGYRRVRLTNKGRRLFIHRIVAEHFLERGDLDIVNHRNLDKKDNSISNLEWCSQKRNINHAVKMGVFRPPRGEKHYSAKLNGKLVKDIREYREKNPKERYVDIAKAFKISRQETRAIILRMSWKDVA